MSELQVRTKLLWESKKDKNKVDGLPRIGQWTVENIRQNIVYKKITATGRTQQSIYYKILGEQHLQISAKDGERAPISTLQYGRGSGKRPPSDDIKEWILAKGLAVKPIPYKRQPSSRWQPKYTPQERGLNSLTWAISGKIAKEGTERYKKNDLEVYTPVLNETIDLFRTFIAKKTQEMIVKTLIK